MAKPPPYPPKDKRPKRATRKPSSMGKVMSFAMGKKVDPMGYIRPKPKKRTGKTVVPKSSKPKPPSNTTYPPSLSHKQLAPRPKQGSKAALLPYQGPKRNSKRK